MGTISPATATTRSAGDPTSSEQGLSAPLPVLVGAARQGAGDAVRSVGDGLQQAGAFMAVELDKAAIVPVEGMFEASRRLREVAGRGGLVGRLADAGARTSNLLGFVGAFYGMVLSGTIQAPGLVAADLTGRVADRIDGRSPSGVGGNAAERPELR